MTKEITKAIILQELQDKLKLREFDPSKFLFDETVVPIYNIESHLGIWKTKFVNKTVTGIGGVLCYTVPDNELWHLSRYDVIFISGSYTVAGVYVVRTNITSPGTFIYLDLAYAQSVSYHTALAKDIVLQPGDAIYVNVDTYVSSGSIRLYIDHLMEEVR